MIKMVATLQRRPELSFEEFRQQWCEEFPVLVRRIPGLRRYVQNLPYAPDRKSWPYDGVAELWFDDVDAVKQAFSTPDGLAASERELTFVQPPSWMLVTEHEVEL